jgi:hypothetical protein
LGVLILLGLVKLGFVFVGGTLFDIKGRRPLLFASLAGRHIYSTSIGKLEGSCHDRFQS